MVSFCSFLVLLFAVQLPPLHAKNDAFGLPKLTLTDACAHAERDGEICQVKQKKSKYSTNHTALILFDH